jgi:leucyl/phenylalanyl-tRNA---protein transferase
MSVYRLSTSTDFPPIANADPDGLIAVGGDLSAERLISAYANGIFPWFDEENPLMWWSPDPRCVLFLDNFNLSKSLERTLRGSTFVVTADTAFRDVIRACRQIKRADQDGTWITEDMQSAYTELHNQGMAHSVEVWREDHLVGGLYGVSLGNAFFGESMFSTVRDASKVAFAHLVGVLRQQHFRFIDCQMHTPHLASLGAVEVPRATFSGMLQGALQQDTHTGSWNHWFQDYTMSWCINPPDAPLPGPS